MHQISLFSPEEDDNLLIHAFSHLNLIWFFPFFDEFKQFGQFDELVRPEDRMRIMTFYKNCIKRQAYFSGSKGYFLSKSPSACSKIGSLYKHFPGCKIIYMIRNPLDVIPSMVNMAYEIWRSTINIEVRFPFQDNIYEILKYYYTYPLGQFVKKPQNAYVIIKYDDLVRQPQLAIQSACQRLDLEVDSKFLSILRQEERKAKNYKSNHNYSIEQTQFTRKQLVSDLHDIFDQFGFDTSL
jgi:hypothetical protein